MSTITIQGLTKSYGKHIALRDLSLDIPSGTIFGLLGANGAGKTTTFKCMLGLARPTSGQVLYGGQPLTPALFERLAYVPERSALWEGLTVDEHLAVQRHTFRHYNAARAAELIELFQLNPRQRVRALSKGQQTALHLVLAFSIEPKILVLDEPTSGLDPINQRAVLKLIIDASARGATVLLSSHQIGQVERTAERIAILRRSELLLTGSVDDLKAERKILEGVCPDDSTQLSGLERDPRIGRIERVGRTIRIVTMNSSDAITSELARLGVTNVRQLDLNLEDIFLEAVEPSSASTLELV